VVNGSIVIYHPKYDVLKQAVESAIQSPHIAKLYIIDNSKQKTEFDYFNHKKVVYIFNSKNVGFGKAHNQAIKISLAEKVKYHVVLNPDVSFTIETIETIVNYLDANEHVAQVMPKILYPDGSIQHLCKLLPTPADLILRRFFPDGNWKQKRNELYELHASGYNSVMNIPYLSGCFMFFRISALEQVGLFDERIFMYIEDADITRRLYQKFETHFLPNAIAHHHYEKGSYKSLKLMLYNSHGAFIYFMKWGWFFDRERSNINKKVIQQYLKKN
jgi:hypothetical protein